MTCALQICDDCAKVRLAVHARAYAVTQPGKHAARTGSSSVVDLLSQPLTRTCETGRGDDTCQRQASHGSRARLTSKSQCVGEDEKLLAELTLQAYSVNIAQGKYPQRMPQRARFPAVTAAVATTIAIAAVPSPSAATDAAVCAYAVTAIANATTVMPP